MTRPDVALERALHLRDIDTLGENHFILELPGLPIGAFSDCTGLEMKREVNEYQEGGNNGFTHKLPGRVSYANLVLKRGVTSQDALQRWFRRSAEGAPEFLDITLKLTDPAGQVMRHWAFSDAFPVRWTGPSLNANSDQAAREELEVAHSGLTIL